MPSDEYRTLARATRFTGNQPGLATIRRALKIAIRPGFSRAVSAAVDRRSARRARRIAPSASTRISAMIFPARRKDPVAQLASADAAIAIDDMSSNFIAARFDEATLRARRANTGSNRAFTSRYQVALEASDACQQVTSCCTRAAASGICQATNRRLFREYTRPSTLRKIPTASAAIDGGVLSGLDNSASISYARYQPGCASGSDADGTIASDVVVVGPAQGAMSRYLRARLGQSVW